MQSKNAGNRNAAIGVFDSGVGGLTVARAIRDQLPAESLIYVGDTAGGPYGPLPLARVRGLALQVMDALVREGVKMLVIACNTASAAVLRDARERYTVPVVEVIGPTVKSAAAITRSGKIGLIGTQATITSRAYDDLFEIIGGIELVSRATPRFVEFVEAGRTSGGEVLRVARDYLTPIVSAGVDTLVLGCTHYPFLRGALSEIMGPDVALVSSDIETANAVYRELTHRDLLAGEGSSSTVSYRATGGETVQFTRLAASMLGGFT